MTRALFGYNRARLGRRIVGYGADAIDTVVSALLEQVDGEFSVSTEDGILTLTFTSPPELTDPAFGGPSFQFNPALLGNGPVQFAGGYILGTPEVGQSLTLFDPILYQSEADAPVLTYQWHVDGFAIIGATDANYLVLPSDAGKQIDCQITATNSGGSTVITTPSLLILNNSLVDVTQAPEFTSTSLTRTPIANGYQFDQAAGNIGNQFYCWQFPVKAGKFYRITGTWNLSSGPGTVNRIQVHPEREGGDVNDFLYNFRVRDLYGAGDNVFDVTTDTAAPADGFVYLRFSQNPATNNFQATITNVAVVEV